MLRRTNAGLICCTSSDKRECRPGLTQQHRTLHRAGIHGVSRVAVGILLFYHGLNRTERKMDMAEHLFKLKADWPGLRNDVGTIEAGNLMTEISIPPEMDGPGIGTNPDEMLLGAAATCYIITLAAMLERAGIRKESLRMVSEAIVDVTNGVFTYKRITHRPELVLKSDADERSLGRAKRLAVKAEETCMISRAVRGNVEIRLEENVTVHGQEAE
ncbi:peroxiredoxin, SACOL1771 subfamily [Edaphobacillus lindanitolerans]|uniref:Peroxiredoxin, SACOL1771 subfamily n=2 Tax=Edaphobacillus lindanitolerans TaxID=550447 RepID=A0A1U7PPG9_9BACI|nr:peroxiredoxin, SACOL1771 subfamily [Edaphobacillus lindanitolerans]